MKCATWWWKAIMLQTKCSHCINLFAEDQQQHRSAALPWANIILLNTPDKAYFSHAADDTTGAHLSKQQTWAQELALPDSCTKSTSNRPHQTPASCSDCDHKTTIIQKQMRELLSPNQPRSHKFVQRDVHTHIQTKLWVNTTVLGYLTARCILCGQSLAHGKQG